MAFPLPPDVKERAKQLCAKYGYLKVLDPGTMLTLGDKLFVLFEDQKGLPVWLDVQTHAPKS